LKDFYSSSAASIVERKFCVVIKTPYQSTNSKIFQKKLQKNFFIPNNVSIFAVY